MFVGVNGGETVCLTQIQVIDHDSFFPERRILPHILPRIKIRLALIEGHLKAIKEQGDSIRPNKAKERSEPKMSV